MANILVVIFAIEVLAQLINALGAAQINDLIWTILNHLPIATSKADAEQRQLQAEYVKVRQEMNATSSQDEFAKWAKLRRRHDKLHSKLEATKRELEASRSQFDNYLTAMRMLAIKVPQYVIPYWYGKEPMFWLPYGWFPYYAEWIISFPRAPLGSVSAPSWQLACSGVIALVIEIAVLVAKRILAPSGTKLAVPAARPAKQQEQQQTAALSDMPQAKKEL
ncbi:hypothetical protein UVI_02042170 [Ustilaginoidea virens]|uniref:Uncharacterized protein n=1 Tax=Ustilaginoidea virens TaxID=1159556 RepID=A0A1B5L8Z3_USTVR|nr:hypothetical protein UVI_02042170 [Ustilaginoidea virens]